MAAENGYDIDAYFDIEDNYIHDLPKRRLTISTRHPSPPKPVTPLLLPA